MKLRLDTEGVGFFCTRAAEQRTDMATGAVRTDRETGLPLFRIQVAALDTSGGEILAVTVVGDPGIAVGTPVQVDGLVAIPWSQGDRSGVAYRAESVRSTGAPIAGVITGARAANPGDPGQASPGPRTGPGKPAA